VRAALFNGLKDIVVTDRPDPVIENPTDAVVRVVLACVYGSDLWYYRGELPHAAGSIGHEFIGIVEDVGVDVTGVAAGDPGSTIGIVGVPHGVVPFNEAFFRNVAWRGGPAPARIYIPELPDGVLEGRINPGLVLDHGTGVDHVAEAYAYAAMDERRAIKPLVTLESR
jgi:threonine dehydrogenase-like Zn-dependent dehydrogenase